LSDDLGPVANLTNASFSQPGDLQDRIRAVIELADDEQRLLLQSAMTRNSLGNLTFDERMALYDLEDKRNG
jgi:hypothetical protein